MDQSQGGVVAQGDAFTLNGPSPSPRGSSTCCPGQRPEGVLPHLDSPKNEPTKLKFTTDFPLKEGTNSVVVVARQTQDFSSRKVLILRRRPADVAQALARGSQMESTARP